MEKLTESQKKLFVEYMNDHEDNVWRQHVEWAQATFHVTVTPEECCKLFIEWTCK